MSNLCKNIVKKSIWKFTDIFPNQVLNFLNIFTEPGKTRTVRKSNYTPALVLPMNMACLKKTKHHTIQLKYQI